MLALGRHVVSLLAGSAVLMVEAVALACMPAAWHPQQDAIILWNDGVQVLVWRTLVEQEPPPGARVEEGTVVPMRGGALAWVLAVPSPPLGYEVVEAADFERTIAWGATLDVPPPPGLAGGGGEGIGIRVGPTVQVGEYDVTPITGTGANAAAGLAAWLRDNHFPPAEPRAVQAYAAENATFLAVKARLPEGTPRAKLRPLAIAFRSAAIVVPIKLSWREPPFGLDITIFSSRVPRLTQNLRYGFGSRLLYATGPDRTHTGLVSIVAGAAVPPELRTIAARVAARVPAMHRLERGSVAVARIVASPLRLVDPGLPDLSIALGDEVPVGAPSMVTDGGGAMPPVPAGAPRPAAAPAEAPPSPTGGAPEADDGCSVAGASRMGGAAALAIVLGALGRRGPLRALGRGRHASGTEDRNHGR